MHPGRAPRCLKQPGRRAGTRTDGRFRTLRTSGCTANQEHYHWKLCWPGLTDLGPRPAGCDAHRCALRHLRRLPRDQLRGAVLSEPRRAMPRLRPGTRRTSTSCLSRALLDNHRVESRCPRQDRAASSDCPRSGRQLPCRQGPAGFDRDIGHSATGIARAQPVRGPSATLQRRVVQPAGVADIRACRDTKPAAAAGSLPDGHGCSLPSTASLRSRLNRRENDQRHRPYVRVTRGEKHP